MIYDGHKAMAALGWHGIKLEGIAFDVMLAAYLLDPAGGEQPIHAIARKFGARSVPAEEDVYGKGAKFRIPDEPDVAAFASQKAAALGELAGRMGEELDRLEMTDLLVGLEQPLSIVLSDMELTGIRVDKEDLIRYGGEIGAQIAELERQIHEHAGGPFNVNSTKQLGEVLFDKLGLPVWKKTKTGYSTDAEVLEKLEPYHPIIGLILHYRTLDQIAIDLCGRVAEGNPAGHGQNPYVFPPGRCRHGQAVQPISELAEHPDPAGGRAEKSARCSCPASRAGSS